MKEVNGKIWIENVSRDVKDVQQLDLNTYRIPARLMQVGGNIEIGPAIPPEYGNGIYCTNLTMKQVIEQVSYVYNEGGADKRTEDNEKEPKEGYSEGLDDSPDSRVDNILASIYRKSKNYRLGQSHLFMGFPVGESLEHLVSSYESDIVPKFDELSMDEKQELLEKLQNVLDNPALRLERAFFTNAIERINASLNLPQNGSNPKRK